MPAFPGRWCRGFPRRGGSGDVVLFGDFLEQILASDRWPGEEFRLWVLGTAAFEVATSVLGVPQEALGIVPRYELFPVPARAPVVPRFGEPWTMVYAGRLSKSKNFGFALRVASALQAELGHEVSFEVYGRPDLMAPQELGTEFCRFPEEMRALLKRLPWLHRPMFHGQVSPWAWVRRRHERPVFASFSNYLLEDFGVAVAQAQSAGWPCVLSDWGGHRDVKGKGVLKIPTVSVGSARESEAFLEGRALAVARDIDAWLRGSGPRSARASPPRSGCMPQVPRAITASELARIRREIARARSRRVFAIPRQGRWRHARTPYGKALFAEYREAFAAPLPRGCRETLVLTPSGELEWPSMREIVPSLERAWAATARAGRSVVRLARLTMDARENLAELMLQGASADRVAATICVRETLSGITILRRHFADPAPLALSLHGEPTSACLAIEPVSGLLRAGDVFLASSARDAKAFRLDFSEADVRVIPFALATRNEFPVPRGRPVLVYCGRVSEQKNLHTLFVALWMLKRDRRAAPRLEVFGEEDGLGSPNMGLRSRGYRRSLERLAARLGIEREVRWMGHWDREALHRRLARRNHVFVSASLHSDENFGAAAFHSLERGARTVLSRWGGHFDFEKAFPGRVFSVPVHGDECGPFVSPCELADSIFSALGEDEDGFLRIPPAYRTRGAATALERLPSGAKTQLAPLRKSAWLDRLHARRARWLSRGADPRKIFSGYEDPETRPYFEAYGMAPAPVARWREGDEFLLAPWARVRERGIEVDDPHRGRFALSLERGPRPRLARDVEGREHALTEGALDWLLGLGYAFPHSRA